MADVAHQHTLKGSIFGAYLAEMEHTLEKVEFRDLLVIVGIVDVECHLQQQVSLVDQLRDLVLIIIII